MLDCCHAVPSAVGVSQQQCKRFLYFEYVQPDIHIQVSSNLYKNCFVQSALGVETMHD
jgi:hypothetical protein